MNQDRGSRDPKRLLAGLASAALVLGAFTGLSLLTWGSGPVLTTVPWFNPLILTFQALLAPSVAFLALGRARVLLDPASYWIGLGFAAYGIAVVFYTLTWPGLLPGGGAILGRIPGTPGWFAVVGAGVLATTLLAATLVSRPAARWLSGPSWTASIAAWIGGFTLLCAAILRFEAALPPMVLSDGRYTRLLLVCDGAIGLAFAAGAALSIRYVVRTGEPLPGYLAFLQLAWAFAELWNVIGLERYDVWWYSQRVVVAAGALVVLLGMLAESVRLYRRELEKTRALEEADRQKDEHMAMLSHELRNPLAAIGSSIELSGARAGGDPVVARAVEIGRRQVANMSRLLEDLLDVARLGRRQMDLHLAPLPIHEVIDEARETIAPRIARGHHELRVALPDAPLVTLGDRMRLAQALVNLLDNAARYTPSGGCIEVAASEEADRAVIRVRDTGRGIASDLLPRVFEPFERGERSSGEADGGLGLGLALVRRVVELHGGDVEAHSEGAGKGSEFVIRLPLATRERLATSRDVARGAPARDAGESTGDQRTASARPASRHARM